MFWADELARRLPPGRPHVVNDSKTPSGTIPISSLRGPITHDAIVRALREAGIETRFTWGTDDMDPMDSQSMKTNEQLAPYMGKPLYAIPAPEAGGTDYADLHANRFLATFPDLGIHPDELYRMRDLYREGKMDREIDLVLRNAETAREVLARVANVKKDTDYFPLNVICENCGRLGTTYVTSYDGHQVTYECRRDLVSWATGCGHRGKTSPFGGRAKLPWNFEWAAQWDLLGVTIEGCGKDLSTAGGSRDRSAALYRAIWKKEPPLNVAYEFVTVGGKKMSTSHAEEWRHLGAAAHEIVELLTGEIVRFFMLRPRPERHIEFDPTGDRIPRLFDEYDRAADAYADDAHSELGRVYALSQLSTEVRTGLRVRFGLLGNWIQIPSVDVRREAEKLVGRGLTDWEKQELERRARVARVWLERWAPEEAKFSVIMDMLPAATHELNPKQRELLRRVVSLLADSFGPEDLQAKIYEIGRDELGLTPKEAFAAVYIAFIGKPSGPKAGWLLSSLKPDFARRRLEEAARA
ncbi:MAG: lysine--tRNA ligase [Chloroflexi bacterium 13_1_40CM_4_68_4]|nr:MAG: lysine--tRNA ligase [Chloroflexi bacterium 13_1_40CM_4_68_4]